jgi:hypothetical protein
MATKTWTPEDGQAMDAAADAARTTLGTLDQKAVEIVRIWWKENYMKAGHKRLARVLLGK